MRPEWPWSGWVGEDALQAEEQPEHRPGVRPRGSSAPWTRSMGGERRVRLGSSPGNGESGGREARVEVPGGAQDLTRAEGEGRGAGLRPLRLGECWVEMEELLTVRVPLSCGLQPHALSHHPRGLERPSGP